MALRDAYSTHTYCWCCGVEGLRLARPRNSGEDMDHVEYAYLELSLLVVAPLGGTC